MTFSRLFFVRFVRFVVTSSGSLDVTITEKYTKHTKKNDLRPTSGRAEFHSCFVRG
jgi:hypothetical protein